MRVLMKITGPGSRLGRASGQTIVLAALCITVLVGFMGVAVDFGFLEHQKRRMQTAADAAAVAGAQALDSGGYVSVAKHDAGLNGFTDGQNGATIAVNNPPTGGAYAGDSSAVEVVISAAEPTFFLRALSINSLNVKARSVALAQNASGCIYALNPSVPGAMQLNGSVSIQSQCGVIVDSSSNSALTANGGASIVASGIGVVGNYSSNGSVTFKPTPTTGIVPVSDPLAYVQAPTYGGCDHTNFSINSSKSATLNPGVYCGGISINGSPTVTFNPGTYILAGGGMSANGSPTLTGTGVTFYNTKGTAGYQPIVLGGSVTATFSAPTSGPLAGMLFFQDRTITSSSGSTLSGGVNSKYEGAVYFPTTGLTYNGGVNAAYTILVANTLTFNGNSTINANYSSLTNGSPIKTASLGE